MVYPTQFHGITLPSFRRDRLERYLAWWDRYLKPGTTAQALSQTSAIEDAAGDDINNHNVQAAGGGLR